VQDRAATPHKFNVGQTVILAPRRYESTPGGTFTIVRAVPTEHGVRQYRIRSNVDGHERIVNEAELH
jgi:hypothetical protein